LILLISTSWVARITGVSHWCPVQFDYFLTYLCICRDSGEVEELRWQTTVSMNFELQCPLSGEAFL
jgi:hypothetical protein